MPELARWGPENPHPLFGRKTELVWDGKHDEYGVRRPVDIAGSAMPMQKIETVDMPRSLGPGREPPRGRAGLCIAQGSGRAADKWLFQPGDEIISVGRL